MKKIFKTFLCLSLLKFSPALLANDFSIWIAPEYKLYNSSFNHDSCNKEDALRVENHIDEELISYIGAEAGLSWRFISLQGNFDWGIPKSCGSLETKNYNVNNGYLEDVRNYDASFDAANFNIDSKLQFDIPVIKNRVNVRPYAGFSYFLKKYNGDFQNGSQDFSKNAGAASSPYSAYSELKSAPDIWFKREMYDIKVGSMVHGDFFDRAFVDLDFALSPFTWLNTKEFDGSTYYLDMMKGFFRQWSLGAGGGVYLGSKKQFEVGVKFKYYILNELTGDTYYSKDENSGFEKFPDGTITHTETVEREEFKYDELGNYKKDENGAYITERTWVSYSYDENYSGVYAKTSANAWQLTIYGKYTLSFGPTHTPKAKASPEKAKKQKKPKTTRVKKGKVNVRVYE